MNAPETNTGGWFESARRIGESLLALVRGRFELFAVELQEEKLRLLKVLVWLGAALAFGIAGVVVGTGALAIWLWNANGYWGLIVLTLAALAVAAGILAAVHRQIKNSPQPFAGVVAEFRKDGECLPKS